MIRLVSSGGIGIYQALIRSKQTSTREFLIANGKMKILPTAMSLWASINSAASFLGTPVEMYFYGTMFIYCSKLVRHSFLRNKYSLHSLFIINCNVFNNEILHS